jgi:hypothetical protein
MIKGFEDIQRFNQQGLDSAMRSWGEWSKGWQAIAAEVNDYTKRSFEDGTATFEKLVGAHSFEQAVEIQTDYAKRCYDEYMARMSRISNLYADLARDAYRPVERVFNGPR